MFAQHLHDAVHQTRHGERCEEIGRALGTPLQGSRPWGAIARHSYALIGSRLSEKADTRCGTITTSACWRYAGRLGRARDPSRNDLRFSLQHLLRVAPSDPARRTRASAPGGSCELDDELDVDARVVQRAQIHGRGSAGRSAGRGRGRRKCSTSTPFGTSVTVRFHRGSLREPGSRPPPRRPVRARARRGAGGAHAREAERGEQPVIGHIVE